MRSAARIVTALVAVCLAGTAQHVRAQDELDPDEVEKLATPLQEGDEASAAKDYPKAIAAYEKLFKKLDQSKLPERVKKNVEMRSRYNYACALALTAKKPEALKAFARSVELGFWDWKHIDEDTDLDSIRKEDDFKKAIENGKVLQKAQQEKDAKEAGDEMKKALAGEPLFDFSFDVKTIDGKTVKLSDLKGKVVIVDFWGTWCPPCRAEIPDFVKLYETYKDQGLEIVGLAFERDAEPEDALKAVKDFASKEKIKYPLSVIDAEFLSKVPDLRAFPTTLFIDKDGKVRVRAVGQREYGVLEGYTKALLDAKKNGKDGKE